MINNTEKEELSPIDKIKKTLGSVTLGGALAAGLPFVSTGTFKLLNRVTPQDTPIGELFADSAIESLGLDKKYPAALHLQSFPRTFSDTMNSSGKDSAFGWLYDFIMPTSDSVGMQSLGAEHNPTTGFIDMDAVNYVGELASPILNGELSGVLPPDKFSKLPGFEGIEQTLDGTPLIKYKGNTLNIRDFVSKPEVSDFVTNKVMKPADIEYIVSSPRNNTAVIAHEFGHVADYIDRADFKKKVPFGEALYKGWDLLATPFIPTHARGLNRKITESLQDAHPVVKTLVNSFTNSATIPSLTVFPLTMSKTLRDTISAIDPTGLAEPVMNIIEEHPVATTVAATLPAAIDELATLAPGYKLTTDFWREFNKGDKGALAKHPLMKANASLVGKKTPWVEGLKFVGSNALNLLPTLAPVLFAAGASLFDTKDEVKEND